MESLSANKINKMKETKERSKKPSTKNEHKQIKIKLRDGMCFVVRKEVVAGEEYMSAKWWRGNLRVRVDFFFFFFY